MIVILAGARKEHEIETPANAEETPAAAVEPKQVFNPSIKLRSIYIQTSEFLLEFNALAVLLLLFERNLIQVL